jgi:glycosyltransferase involved in cell wall biosynthesis
MRIALLIPDLVKEGGGERQAVRLAAELLAMGEDVTVFTNVVDPPACYPNVTSLLKVVGAGHHPLATHLPSRRLGDYFDMRRLAAAVTDTFDVLNPHHWPPHWAAAWAADRAAQRPAVVWMCNDPPWRFGPGERPEALRAKGPLKRALRAFFLRYDLAAVKRLDCAVVLSHRARRVFEEVYGTSARVVRSGVDLPSLRGERSHEVALSIRTKHGLRPETFLLLTVNILMPQRRIDDVVEAMARLLAHGHDAHLLAVGSTTYDPACAERLRMLVRQRGLEGHVTLTGSVPESELGAYYDACDAYVHPNEEQTWGLAVIEAMAHGKPVVVSTGAGVHEVLSHGANALLVPPRRADVIAGAVQRLLSDEALRRRLGFQAREFVERTLSWRRYAESMARVFEEAVAAQREARAAATAVQAT